MHPLDQLTLLFKAMLIILGSIYFARFAVLVYSFPWESSW